MVSVVGTRMQLAALFWHIKELTDEPIALGMIGAARILPVIIFSLLGGAVADALNTAHHSYVIENNATGQLARLIKAETGYDVSGKILKFDGRPFTPAYIAKAIRKEER